MKKLTSIILLASTCLYYGCQSVESGQIEPQSIQKTQLPGRNLKVADTLKPDLTTYSFVCYTPVTSDASSFYIPFVVKETNTGTRNDTGAYADSLKVYQKIPTGLLTFSLRLVGTYVRTANIPINGSFFINSTIRFPRKWRPASGQINLVFKADGANTIAELNETNNYSNTVWGFVLP